MPDSAATTHFDLVIVGGGVNGSGIAVDATGRGLKVLLCEQDDLAAGTSAKSSKLIHGGLRYLEYFEFKLVREALAEREILLRKAPHIIRPLRFRLPHTGLRPAWMLRLGLWLYDHLASRQTLAPSKRISFDASDQLRQPAPTGFEYADAWVDDSRLVVLNAVSAHALGCEIRTRTTCIGAQRDNHKWHIQLRHPRHGTTTVTAAALVNAAGPWVEQFLTQALPSAPRKPLRLVKGSHIVVPKIHNHDHAYLLQHTDRRVIFVLPYETDFSLIGTTEHAFAGDPATATISTDERDYLLNTINSNFCVQLSADDIVHSFAGVRPLVDDAATNARAVSREYVLSLSDADGSAPLLSVYGGKITTYRSLAEAALTKLQPYFESMLPAWTATAPLAGGDIPSRATLTTQLQHRYPFLSASLCARYARCYGSLSFTLLAQTQSLAAMGEDFGCQLYAREVMYLIDHEFAVTADDILWRRSKLGLYSKRINVVALSHFIAMYLDQINHALAGQAMP